MTTTSAQPDYVNEQSEVTNSTTAVATNDPSFRPLAASGETSILMDTITPESTQVNVSTTDNVKNLGKKVKGKPSKADGDAKKGIVAAVLGGSIVTLIILGLLSIIPILQVIIGWRYADQCPIQPRIPHYLVVAGVIGLVSFGILLVENLISIFITKKVVEDGSKNPEKFAIASACGTCCLSIVSFCLNVFLIGWFIAGCIWVFSVWNDVQYTHPTGSNYCHKTLYRFAFWLLLISILYHLFSCIRSCFQARQQRATQTKSVIRVPTAEP